MSEETKKEQQSSVRSFRVTGDVMERFNSIKEELKLSQDGTLGLLVGAYEMEQAKKVLPSRETEIANFQMKARELVEAYLFSLQLNADAEDRVRADVALKIESLEKTIATFQAQVEQERAKVALLEGEKAGLEASITELDQLRFELSKAMEEQAELKTLHEKQLADKENIICMLQDKLSVSEEMVSDYARMKEAQNTLSADLKATQEALYKQQRDHELQIERASRAGEKALDTAVAAEKAESAEKIDQLKNQLQQAQIDTERRLRESEKESADEIRKLEQEIRGVEQENTRLREQLRLLKTKE